MNDEKSKGEPSAPTTADGELARLLPDLPHRIAYARQAARDDEPLDAAIRDLADACELLLAERERVAGKASVYMAERDAAVDWANRERARIAELTATPPPGTVAALLARVEAEAVPDRSTWRDYARGLNKAADIIRATLTPSPLDAVAAEVCALPVEMPTFYASVDSVEDGLHAVDMLIGDHELSRRDRLARIARVALAGMLACDAPATKEPDQ